jgi:hypothetical protein
MMTPPTMITGDGIVDLVDGIDWRGSLCAAIPAAVVSSGAELQSEEGRFGYELSARGCALQYDVQCMRP